MKKIPHGALIRVEWVDPQSDSAWIGKSDENLEPAQCVHVGFFNFIKQGKLYLYASYNEQDIGDRTVILTSLIKKIEILNENGKSCYTKRRR